MVLRRRPYQLLAVIGGISLWLSAVYRQHILFYLNLIRASFIARRYYARCPEVIKGIRYCSSNGPCLDIYRPAGADGCPVFIYVYGGSWTSGSKELYAPIAQRLLPEGVVVVIPDYTTFPPGGYPRQPQEIAAAIAWTIENIERFGGDPQRIVIASQSAGAHIAGLALLDPRWLGAHGHSAAEIRGFIGISGVYDIPAELKHLAPRPGAARYITHVMGGPENLQAASPIQFVGSHAPPMLLIHGECDTSVPVNISIEFHKRLQAAGVPSELLIYANGGHSAILFEALSRRSARLVTDMVRFVRDRTSDSGGQLPGQLA